MGMNLYNCRTYNNKQLNGYSVDNYHVVFLFSGDIDKIPFKYSPTSLLPCGSPEASEIFAHSLKAKFPISFLDSVFWIPLELIWVVGCLAISVYYLCVLLFPQFPQTHKHICTYTCTLGASILCTANLFSKGIHCVIFQCFFKDIFLCLSILIENIIHS